MRDVNANDELRMSNKKSPSSELSGYFGAYGIDPISILRLTQSVYSLAQGKVRPAVVRYTTACVNVCIEIGSAAYTLLRALCIYYSKFPQRNTI